ncbi:MAG: helix-turn-helix transcriptional regulator [Candidatus Thermoplasmatota archaeon]|nr:helix-turn-helix transcriptional regulator [Candidatus Thermoplasmatota archaeon]
MQFSPKKLRKLMAARGLNATQLAAQVGVTEGSVDNWRAGRREPNATKTGRLCKALACEVGDLMDGGE